MSVWSAIGGFVLATLLIGISGCGAYRATVYGTDGSAYTAPDLCAAELACKNAGQKECYFATETTTVIDPQTGQKTKVVYSCRKQKLQ